MSSSEEDDQPTVRQKMKKNFIISSDTEDSSDEEIFPANKKKKVVIISDDESLEDSEPGDFSTNGETSEAWESDWESDVIMDEFGCVVDESTVETKNNTMSSDDDSDKSDDGEGEKCAICLGPFKLKKVATPSSCKHVFCFECISEWGKNKTTCPTDRTEFNQIVVRNKFGGEIIDVVDVTPVTAEPINEEDMMVDLLACQICHHTDREDRMLLCDGCNLGFHMECLDPPLAHVPIEDWHCPACHVIVRSDEEEDLNSQEQTEQNALLVEARALGQTYGRGNRAVVTRQLHDALATSSASHSRRQRPTTERRRVLDPDQPSTSSTSFESVSDNSRSYSPQPSTSRGSSSSVAGTLRRRRGAPQIDVRKTKKAKTKKKTRKSIKKVAGSSTTSERKRVVITEIDEDGNEVETVTYVKISKKVPKKKKSRKKKMRKKRQRRNIDRARSKTIKGRLAKTLGICTRGVSAVVPTLKNIASTVTSEQSSLVNARYGAGISQVSLFGRNLGLDYSPPGSEDESESAMGGGRLEVQTRPRSTLNATRRRMVLKGISPSSRITPLATPDPANLLDSIMSAQELWHSNNNNKKNSITLKADGSFVIIKDKEEEKPRVAPTGNIEKATALPLSSGNKKEEDMPGNMITQAPMYNSPRAGGGGHRGQFRGGYRGGGGGGGGGDSNNRHSYGGQSYNNNNNNNSQDSYSSGRHSFGGGNNSREFGNHHHHMANYEHRSGPMPFPGNPMFRNRNPQHFRNRFPGPQENSERHFGFQEQQQRFPPPPQMLHRGPRPGPPPGGVLAPQQQSAPPPLMSLNLSSRSMGGLDNFDVTMPDVDEEHVENDEECDLYSDIQVATSKQEDENQDASHVLPPPPEPPSGLLDFEESKSERDKDSDQEELVIDDTPKEDVKDDSVVGGEEGDKYDPFEEPETDSNDSKSEKSEERKGAGGGVAVEVAAASSSTVDEDKQPAPHESQHAEKHKSLLNLTAYDDDEEEDSQSDCPNFSIYSSQTMDVARHSQQQSIAEICPLEPPPMPPSIPDDDEDDMIVGDIQACDLADIPEPVDPYVEALRRERQALSKIPPKKISNDSRGKITFKIEKVKMKLNCKKLSNLYDEMDESMAMSIEQEKETEKEAAKDDNDESKENENREMTEESEDIFPEKVEQAKKDVEEEKEEEEVRENLTPPIVPEMETYTPERVVCEDEDSMKVAEEKASKLTLDEDEEKKIDDEEDEEEEEEGGQLSSNGNEESESFPLEKEKDKEDEVDKGSSVQEEEEEEEEEEGEEDMAQSAGATAAWESDGAYTPCKDELPVKDSSSLMLAMSGLEPITPTKDKSNDDLGGTDLGDDDGCRTPAGYAGLGTEAISETDEAINFEDEMPGASKTKGGKDVEDGEIMDEKGNKIKDKTKAKDYDDKKRKKKDKKEKSTKEVEKNKENISSENLVSWKKVSKSTKERQYRDKRSRSREPKDQQSSASGKERGGARKKSRDETQQQQPAKTNRKEKRKELPRYDVRKLVADKPRKDEYGRDVRDVAASKSLSRSPSRGRRSPSFSRGGRSRSRSQASWGRGCRSLSRIKSRSSRHRATRRSPASRKRSPSRRRSVSRRRSRSTSRGRRRSLSPRRKSRRRSASRDRKRRSRTRSNERRKKKQQQNRSRSRSKNRKRSRSRSAKRSRDKRHGGKGRRLTTRSRSPVKRPVSRDAERGRWEATAATSEKVVRERGSGDAAHYVNRDDSWSAQWTPSWSRSRSKTPPLPQGGEMMSRDWSPPPQTVLNDVPPKNLTVILTNKEAMKKKKKEKRNKDAKKSSKEADKRGSGRRNRRPRNAAVPSKEVFASGDNILVSVCFNKEKENLESAMMMDPEALPMLTTQQGVSNSGGSKRRRRDTPPPRLEPASKRSKKDKTRERQRSKSPKARKEKKKKKSKAAEIAASKKPVAVIDLDQSPFREQTPSPRDVIVLSDDDDKQAQTATPEGGMQQQTGQSTPQHEQFISQGPKTPPEPQVKFSINKQTNNLRPSMMNPLLDEDDEDEGGAGGGEGEGEERDEVEEEEEEDGEGEEEDGGEEEEGGLGGGEHMDEGADEELEMRAQEELELRLKIGPNTPPEPPSSPQTSPDAYDPFDPTKSRSPTPPASQEATPLTDERNARGSPGRKHDLTTETLPTSEAPQQQQQQQSEQQQQLQLPEKQQSEKPKIISVVTLKRAISPPREAVAPATDGATELLGASQIESSPSKSQQQSQQSDKLAIINSFQPMNPVLATVAAAVQRSSILGVVNAQRNLIQGNRISPSAQGKQQQRPQLANIIFVNSVKPGMGGRAGTKMSSQSKTSGQNGNDANLEASDVIDMSSPYSPGSTLSDGMFDPPSPGASPPILSSAGAAAPAALLPVISAPKANAAKNKIEAKKDLFDALFDSSPGNRIVGGKNKSKKGGDKRKKQQSTYQPMSYGANSKVGVRMDENQLQILDDLPSSAVEMQVKDKFLKKLNRQERVVEEVKLVLKPHYTKKHVTKEEYKDIMRKAVPKICHNRSGEINPKKIAHLIEAYVKKCRNKKRTGIAGNNASANKTKKTLWS